MRFAPAVMYDVGLARGLARGRGKIQQLLARAGVSLDGNRPWDIEVHDERIYRRVLAAGSLGLGEAYMEGWWDCEALDEFFFRLLRARVDDEVSGLGADLALARGKLFNLQRRAHAYQIGERHYDVSNQLFEAMLDRRMLYSCACWEDAATLDEAQETKLDRTCRKLMLRPGMRLLDIGCGWGGAVAFAAERYGVEAVGITVSKEQARFAQVSCRGLPVEIRLQDYRDLDEQFDRVLSVGMFEHVGHKNYRSYMRTVRRCLADDGLFFLQTIGKDSSRGWIDPWITRYIFPRSELPSAAWITAALEGRFALQSWQNFGPDYDKTLMAWHRNLDGAWDSLQQQHDHRFRRMWEYYLLSCAGAFRARRIHLWQILLSAAPSAPDS